MRCTDRPRIPIVARRTLAALLLVALASPAAGAAVAAPDPETPASRESAAPVDLNSAGVEQLQTVPGIGPATAARIVAFREEHGPFRRVEDLVKIRGIGEKNFAKIRPHVRVGSTG